MHSTLTLLVHIRHRHLFKKDRYHAHVICYDVNSSFSSSNYSLGNHFLQVCLGSTNLGGDGSSAAKVSVSCAALQTYFGLNAGLAYLDVTVASLPLASNALRVYCSSGTNQVRTPRDSPKYGL
jgi:hypothetical protein